MLLALSVNPYRGYVLYYQNNIIGIIMSITLGAYHTIVCCIFQNIKAVRFYNHISLLPSSVSPRWTIVFAFPDVTVKGVFWTAYFWGCFFPLWLLLDFCRWQWQWKASRTLYDGGRSQAVAPNNTELFTCRAPCDYRIKVYTFTRVKSTCYQITCKETWQLTDLV